MQAYAHKSIPAHWIIDDGAQAYLVPAITQGWRKRIKLADNTLIASADPIEISQLHGIGLPDTPFALWLSQMGAIRGSSRPMDQKVAAELIGISQDTATKYKRAKTLPHTILMAMAAAKAGLTPFSGDERSGGESPK